MRKAHLLLLVPLVVCLLAGCGGGDATRMTWVEDSACTLYGVCALRTGRAWAVGKGGAILHDDGPSPEGVPGDTRRWTEQESGVTVDLKAVTALESGQAWAVGDRGTILFNDGSGWLRQESGTDAELTGVSALDGRHAWACGWGETILFYDGQGWERQSGGDAVLRCVDALDSDHVWAVGSGGTILFYDGHGWSRQESGTGEELTGVSALSGEDAWACGLNGTVLHYDGRWRGVRSGDEMFRGLEVVDERDLWVVGYRTRAFSITPGSVVLRYSGSWENVEIDSNLYPTGVSARSDVWVSGLSGVAIGSVR